MASITGSKLSDPWESFTDCEVVEARKSVPVNIMQLHSRKFDETTEKVSMVYDYVIQPLAMGIATNLIPSWRVGLACISAVALLRRPAVTSAAQFLHCSPKG